MQSFDQVRIMMGLFFEKGEKVNFLPGGSYLRVSNNLDSHYYVLERVKNSSKDYVQQNYFQGPHPQLLEYYTAWQEKELVQEETQIVAKPKERKEKKGIIGGLLSKKSKNENISGKGTVKQLKEETQVTTIQEEVLYIQLQSFSQVNVPTETQQAKEFMALIYLLSMRIFEKFNCWPQMIPVITESKRYKFVKKGGKVELELARLFEFVYREEKMKALGSWSSEVAAKISEIQNENERKEALGSFLKSELQTILQGQFSIRLKKGQESQVLAVAVEDAFTLVFKQLSQQISLDEYQVSYYHQDSQRRQIIMEHNIQPPLILEGNRSNLIIKYLKQFVIG